MCLTVCRQRDVIYDSDRLVVCKSCSLYKRQDEKQSCETCKHRFVDGKGTALCLLSQMTTPTSKWCCHWNSKPKLAYYEGALSKVDGIVLVAEEDFEEAMQDYLRDHPLLDSVQPIKNMDELLDSLDVDESEINFDEPASFDDIQVQMSEDLFSDFFETKKPDYRVVGEKERHTGIYVPIVVGTPLVKYHKGVEEVTLWFERIYGSRDDILRDWKGRWIVKPIRFAIPAVYGVESPRWSKLVDEDLTDQLHAAFA